jgi:hypothetical protein
MTKFLMFGTALLTAAFSFGQSTPWATNTGRGVAAVPTHTVATLPAPGIPNRTVTVTDGDGNSCTAGGGSSAVLCRDTGSAWVVVGNIGGGGSAAWGGITGTLSAQTDLQGALNAKAAWDHNHAGTYEPAFASGLAGQYFRGDKSWQTLNASAVGLGNVDNTSDASKPVSTATQTALNGKANTSHGHAESDVTNLTTDLAAKVPTSRTVNGHALSGDVSVTASDSVWAAWRTPLSLHGQGARA